MRALIGWFLLLAVPVMLAACVPVTDSQTAGAPSLQDASTPFSPALKHVFPRPPSPTAPFSGPDSAYPNPPLPTVTADAYPRGGMESESIQERVDPLNFFLATRAAEMNVSQLRGDMLSEAMKLYEGTRQAYLWRKTDEEMLQDLALSWEPIVELQPGESYQFEVGLRTSILLAFPQIQKSWHLSPSVGAMIDADSGLLTIDEDTPHGTVYTVTADVENGRARPSIKVYVYDPQEDPLIGRWREEKEVTCADKQEISPAQAMDELRFLADGTFTVVWFVFEDLHADYRGTYDYDLASGELVLSVEDSAYLPPDFDGSGSAVVEGGSTLILEDMWLGKPQNMESSTNCGHTFLRAQRKVETEN